MSNPGLSDPQDLALAATDARSSVAVVPDEMGTSDETAGVVELSGATPETSAPGTPAPAPLTMSGEVSGKTSGEVSCVPPVTSVAVPPAGAAPLVSADVARVLADQLQPVFQQQQQLLDLFSSKLLSDEAQARAVERLHDELRSYKTNFIRQEMLPLLKEIIFCHDFVTREMQSRKVSAADGAGGGDLKSWELMGQMLLDLLFKYDVEPYRSETPTFDPKTQQCTRTIPTPQAAEDRKIAEVGLTGFTSPSGLVRREQVSVYKYKGAEN